MFPPIMFMQTCIVPSQPLSPRKSVGNLLQFRFAICWLDMHRDAHAVVENFVLQQCLQRVSACM